LIEIEQSHFINIQKFNKMKNQIILHQTPLEDIKLFLENIVSEQFKKYQSDRQSKPEIEVLSRKETAEKLGVTLPTLHLWTKNGTIQGTRIGKRCIRYRASDVEAALKNINSKPSKR
jgi:excisionase family DNA binding protein